MVIKCRKCGLEKSRLSYPEGICDQCIKKEDEVKFIDTVNIPEDVVFISKLAHMGNRRIIEIPKKQRSFLKDDTEYIVIIKRK